MSVHDISKISKQDYIHKTAIIGSDERNDVPSTYRNLSRGIGILVEANRKKSGACTAFCVAPNVIATNAHCIVNNPLTQKTRDLSKVRFILPPIRKIIYKRKVPSTLTTTSSFFEQSLKRITKNTNFFIGLKKEEEKQKLRQVQISPLKIVSSAQPRLSIFSGDYKLQDNIHNQTHDWALAKLANNICQNRVLSFRNAPMSRLLRAGRRDEIFMIGFHGDHKMRNRKISKPCRIRYRKNKNYLQDAQKRAGKYAGMLIPHTCDGVGGSSGAPIFLSTEQSAHVIGINMSTFQQARYSALRNKHTGEIEKKRLISRHQINMAVQPVNFIAHLNRYKRESLLENIAEFKDVQKLLKKFHFYNGPVDGDFGLRTRFAIERFERKNNLIELGLPTQELLERLRHYDRRHDNYFKRVVSDTKRPNITSKPDKNKLSRSYNDAVSQKHSYGLQKPQRRFGRRYHAGSPDSFLDRIAQ